MQNSRQESHSERRLGRRLRLIIMASGLSRRFAGRNKLLAPWQGEALCLPVLRAAAAVRAEYPADIAVFVVTGHEDVAALARTQGLTVIHNPCPEEGQSVSIRLGVRAKAPWPPEAEEAPAARGESALFLPADQPLITKDELERFCLEAAAREEPLLRAWDGTRYGSPTAFDRRFYDELAALRGDDGGKVILRRYPELCGKVRLKPESLMDIDTAEELTRLRERKAETEERA